MVTIDCRKLVQMVVRSASLSSLLASTLASLVVALPATVAAAWT